MLKISIATWIANAAACLTGTYGDVTHQAESADCSRQTVYDHAQKVPAAVGAEHAGGPTRAALIQENERLRQENARLWDWLAQTIEFPAHKQHEFAVTATAMGLSLNPMESTASGGETPTGSAVPGVDRDGPYRGRHRGT